MKIWNAKHKLLVLVCLLLLARKVQTAPQKTEITELKGPRSIIKNKGSVMGSVTLISYGIPLSLTEFDDVIIGLRRQVDLIRPEIEENGHICEVCDNLDRFEKDVKRMKKPFEEEEKLQRSKRFVGLMIAGLIFLVVGAVAAGFTVYSNIKTAQSLQKLQTETNEVFVSGERNSKKVGIFEEFEKNISSIQSSVVDSMDLERRQGVIQSTITKYHKRQKELQLTIFHARNNVLWDGIEEFTDLSKGIETVKSHIAKFKNYTLLLPSFNDIFHTEISYTCALSSMQCMIYVHFKIALDTKVHQVYQIQTFPILTEEGKMVNIIQPKRYITVDEKDKQFSLINPNVFEVCKLTFNETNLCKNNPLKLSNTLMNTTCEGALLMSDLPKVLQYCGYTESKPKPFAAKIGEFKIAMYSPDKDIITCMCPYSNKNTGLLEYYPHSFSVHGTTILSIEPNCRCTSKLFEYSTGMDFTKAINGSVDKYEEKFNQQSFSMTIHDMKKTKLEEQVDSLLVPGDKAYEDRTKVEQKDLHFDFLDGFEWSWWNIIMTVVVGGLVFWNLSLTFVICMLFKYRN